MHERYPPTRNLESSTFKGFCIRAAPGHTPRADEAPYGGESDRVSKLPNYRHLASRLPLLEDCRIQDSESHCRGRQTSHDVFVAGGWGVRVATGNDSRSAIHLREATSFRLTHSPSVLHCRAPNVEARCGPLKVDTVRDLCARHRVRRCPSPEVPFCLPAATFPSETHPCKMSSTRRDSTVGVSTPWTISRAPLHACKKSLASTRG